MEKLNEFIIEENDRMFEDVEEIQDTIDCVCDQFGDGEVIINGSLGLWDGRHVIEPTREENIRKAIYRCLGRDGEFIYESDIKLEVDCVELVVRHHDGNNYFEITLSDDEEEDEE